MTAFYRLMLGSCGLLVAGPAAFAVTTDVAVAGSTALVTQVTAPAPVVPPTETEQLAAEVEAALQALAKGNFSLDPGAASGAAIEAAVRTLDPAARLLSAEQAAHLSDEAAGRDYSFGVCLAMTNGQPVVVDVTAAAPEATAGLQPGDLLRAIDGSAATNLTLPVALALLRGDAATTARFVLVRSGAVLTNEGVRALMNLEAVELAEKLPRDLAYMKVNGLFGAEAGRQIVSTLRGWAETGRYGFILDLRGAGGDNLKAVETVGSLYARGGAILCSFRDRQDQDVSVHKAMEGSPLETPVIVLVDGQTRGAAEVLAAVLADSVRGALLIGTPTAGDPLIRDVVALPGGRLIYLANRRLVTADGAVYDGRAGLTPDVAAGAPATAADYYEPENVPDRRETLPQEVEDRALRDRIRGDQALRQAVDVLLGLKALNIRANGVSSK